MRTSEKWKKSERDGYFEEQGTRRSVAQGRNVKVANSTACEHSFSWGVESLVQRRPGREYCSEYCAGEKKLLARMS